MKKNKKLIIFGIREFAEIAYEYFTHDSPYQVVAFAVQKKYKDKDKFFGKPVIAFEDIEKKFPSKDHHIYAAIVYGELNRTRERILKEIRKKKYKPASYISSRSFVWHNAKIGEHCFIFENNTIQPFVEVKDNVVLWSGNHIGHGSVIRENAFISSHVVVSGNCDIGKNCFIGVNATLGNNIKIGANSWVSSAAVITQDVPASSLVKSAKSEVAPLNEELLFKKLRG